jgi:hypothetical protein
MNEWIITRKYGSWWDDPYDSIVEKMPSHWGGRAVSSMGLSPVSSVRSRLDYKIKILLGSSTFCHLKEKVNFLCLNCVLYCIFFLQTVHTAMFGIFGSSENGWRTEQ